MAAAIAARRKGFTVTVADGAQPPIDKACGEGMMPETQLALRDLGVEIPADVGYRFRGIQFTQGTLRATAEFPKGQGVGFRRTLLHQLLIHKAEECGVKMFWKTPVAGINAEGVQLPSGTLPARWIIGADGCGSRVRRWSGLAATVRESHRTACRRHYRVRPWTEYAVIHWGVRVQAYVTPISSEEVCVVVMGETAEDTEFPRALEAMPELRERLAGAQLCSRERGAMTAMHSLRRVWRGNIALVGDASGSVDAITGEGLRLAFRQALALADALASGELHEYGRAHWKLTRRPRWMAQLMLQLVGNAGFRSRVLRRLNQNPELFARLLAIHVGRATASDVVRAGAQLGWQILAA